jgi:MFS family permease
MNLLNPSPTPTNVRFGVLGFVCCLSLITYLDRVCIMQVAPEIREDLGISEEQMGLIFSAFLLGYTLFEVPGGWLGDRWGSRRVLLRIVLWWSLFTALTGSVQRFAIGYQADVNLFGVAFALGLNSFMALLSIRFLFGCGEAGAYPNVARVVGSWFPFRERGFAQGSVWFSARMGGAIAPFVIVGLSGLVGWQRSFSVLGLIGVLWCVGFWWWFHDRPEDMAGCNAAEREIIRAGPHSWGSHEAGHGHGNVPWRQMLTSWNLWAVCLAAFCVSFGWYFYPTWQPKFLEEVHHISYKDSKFLTGLPFLCGALGCLLGGHLSDWAIRRTGNRRWGRSLIGIVGFTGAGLCVLATPFVAEAWQAVALLCLAFFINDLAIPVIWAVGTDIGGRHAGTVSGFMNMIGALGGMISPAMTPVLKNNLPEGWSAGMRWQVIFAVLASAWFIAALAWLRIDASKRLFPDDSPH